MITQTYRPPQLQRGVVLATSLLLLLVVTIMALSMFRGFGIQEKVAGNMREKQRALQAAVSAQTYAEQWLIANAGISPPVVCAPPIQNANAQQGQICSNALWLNVASVTTLPWQIGGNNVGVTYTPPGMSVAAVNQSAPSNNSYALAPIFYISDGGPSADPNVPGEVYQIDAAGYGGNGNTAAVVESTYAVYSSSNNRGGL